MTSEKVYAQWNTPKDPAGPDTPVEEWESSGAYPELGSTYYDKDPEKEAG
jgi:hypothetical protein